MFEGLIQGTFHVRLMEAIMRHFVASLLRSWFANSVTVQHSHTISIAVQSKIDDGRPQNVKFKGNKMHNFLVGVAPLPRSLTHTTGIIADVFPSFQDNTRCKQISS